MKRFFALLISFLMLLSFCGCDSQPAESKQSDDPASNMESPIDPAPESTPTSEPSSEITEPEPTDPPLAFGDTIAAGDGISAAITNDGNLMLAGDFSSSYGVNIISLAIYSDHLVALKSDNTVSVYNKSGYRTELYDLATVRAWTEIVEIAAGAASTFGIKADGTVVGAGYSPDDFKKIATWTDIIAIDTYGYNYCVGLKSDGTVVSDNKELDFSDWTDIIAISAQSGYVLGLKSDGTVLAIGKQNNPCIKVGGWTDIVAICAGLNHAVGLKADGTVVSTVIEDSNFDFGQTNVSGWSNIVAISANYTHTLGLKADGTVVVAGSHADDPEIIAEWTNIATP